MTKVTTASHTTTRLLRIARYQRLHRARLACMHAGQWQLAAFCDYQMKRLLPTLKPACIGPAQ